MGVLNRLIKYVKNNPRSKVASFFAYIYSFWGWNSVRGASGNKIKLSGAYLKHVKIRIKGKGNIIDLSNGSNYLNSCTINVYGNNNKVVLGERNVFFDAEFHIEDDNNTIKFNNHNRILGRTHIACCEGTEILFGSDSLFSTDVTFRTSDSHSILDLDGNRINPASSICVKDRVWFGNKTIVLKGVTIANDSIVGSGAVVTRNIPSNSIVVGNPARVVKTGVKWDICRM